MERAIITSCSTKFFPNLINLLGSLNENYPDHPPVFVYDIGLIWPFRLELERMVNVKVLSVPPFVPFWRSCYTWKTYIFTQSVARLNLYLDAGNQVLRPLDEIFEIIDRDDYFTVSQNLPLKEITPSSFRAIFELPEYFYEETCITAGIFGFKENSRVTKVVDYLHQASVAGLCIGFSKNEQWKNKGVNKNFFLRDCNFFRHDTTLISIVMHKFFGKYKIHDAMKYGGPFSSSDHPEQLIWNLRLGYKQLQFIDPQYSTAHGLLVKINRAIISLMIGFKRINRLLKNI